MAAFSFVMQKPSSTTCPNIPGAVHLKNFMKVLSLDQPALFIIAARLTLGFVAAGEDAIAI